MSLNFKSLEDFEPTQVARQIKPLNDLLELRTKLSDLRGSLQGNDKLDDILEATLRSTDKLDRLKTEISGDSGIK